MAFTPIPLLTAVNDSSVLIDQLNKLIIQFNTAMAGINGLPLGGGTMTGPLVLNADPTAQLGACTKQYADSILAGFVYKGSVAAATITNLNATYANGTLGVGATLTNAGAQIAFAADGYSASLNDIILVPNQSSAAQNGLYTVTTVGTGATNWVLTRATNFNQASNVVQGSFVNVLNGSTVKNSEWILTSSGPFTIGTTALTFTNFGADFLISGNNLSDLDSAVTARTNLGLGTSAVLDSSTFAQVANNLSDITASTARTNLGLGALALLASIDLSGGQATGILASARFPGLSGAISTSVGSTVTNLTAGSVSASSLAAGAAIANIGALAGDLTGTLPSPTVSMLGGVAVGALATQNGTWQNFTPVLQGASDNPAVNYTTQIGRYCQIGHIVYFKITIATSSITKSTLTDNLRISLPSTAFNNVSEITQCDARVENATAVLNATIGEIAANTNYIQFRTIPIASASALLTYGLTSLGLLSNAITIRVSGFYEV